MPDSADRISVSVRFESVRDVPRGRSVTGSGSTQLGLSVGGSRFINAGLLPVGHDNGVAERGQCSPATNVIAEEIQIPPHPPRTGWAESLALV